MLWLPFPITPGAGEGVLAASDAADADDDEEEGPPKKSAAAPVSMAPAEADLGIDRA